MGIWSYFRSSIGNTSWAVKDRVVGNTSPTDISRNINETDFEQSTEYITDISDKPNSNRWRLLVEDIDMSIRVNGRAHFTEKYYTMDSHKQLVIRRGSVFKMVITFSREYQPKHDFVSLIFKYSYSDTPNHGQGTYVQVPLLTAAVDDAESWSAVIRKIEGNTTNIRVKTPANCICGEWKLEVDTRVHQVHTYIASFIYHKDIFIIFNPWCKEDQVFLEGDDLRKEYVLADSGYIYRGDENNMMPKIWNYAQFSKDVLECTFYVLKSIQKPIVPFGADAVKVTRALSSVITSYEDDNCIIRPLLDNKLKSFDNGTLPTDWVGSMEIMQKYFERKRPVKYGQCWVFAGVLTTACRAIGIPCRPVTNFSSGHSKNGAMTVDYYIDWRGDIIHSITSDSVWNFHVWSEVWMRREDLDDINNAYGGWQVIDPTPREVNYKQVSVGPTSVHAVKGQEVYKPYDTEYVVSEVLAAVLLWRLPAKGCLRKLVFRRTDQVGRNISTKAVGKWQREDITHTYKNEDTQVEYGSQIYNKILNYYSEISSRLQLNEENPNISFELKLNHTALIGQPLEIILKIWNTNPDSIVYMAHGFLRIYARDYTGVHYEIMKSITFLKSIKENTEKTLNIVLDWTEYSKYLVLQSTFTVVYMVSVDNIHYDHYHAENFTFRKPNIDIKLKEYVIEVGDPLSGKVCLRNPLPVPIKKGYFVFEGSGLDEQYTEKVYDIKANEEIVVDFQLAPRYAGKGVLAVKFSSKYLNDIDGFEQFIVDRKHLKVFDRENVPVAADSPDNRISAVSSLQSIGTKPLQKEEKSEDGSLTSIKSTKSLKYMPGPAKGCTRIVKPGTQVSVEGFSVGTGVSPSLLSLI